MKIAVVGATGLVGTKMLEVLAERNFPVTELLPVASEKSVGKKIMFHLKTDNFPLFRYAVGVLDGRGEKIIRCIENIYGQHKKIEDILRVQTYYEKLHMVTKVVTNNLNKVIDVNFYPTEKTKTSNLRHRPIGIGVQGLADAFILLDIAFHSDEAKEVNKLIFETMYHAALEKSNELAIERMIRGKGDLGFLKTQQNKNALNFCDLNDFIFIKEEIEKLDEDRCGSYSSFIGSPASQGILQYDMWTNFAGLSSRYDWTKLKGSILKHGLRNSLLMAPMPTASTSQILGFNECFEPLTSNLYSRRTLAGEFVVVNKYLMKELIELGQWNEQIKTNFVSG